MASPFLPNPTLIQMAKGPARTTHPCSQTPLQLEQSRDSVLSDQLEVEVSPGEHSFPLPPPEVKMLRIESIYDLLLP